MSWNKVVQQQLTCANCTNPGPSALSRVEAALEAVAVGWAYSGRPLHKASQWLCPDCKTELVAAEGQKHVG